MLGIDCSGLTSMCYMLCGVYIYRNAGYVDGFAVHEIPAAEKKPGDAALSSKGSCFPRRAVRTCLPHAPAY